MIEGLKVTVKGTEVKQLCEKRAAHHLERADTYNKQRMNLDSAQIEAAQLSGGDPRRALDAKFKEHISLHEELVFIAEHIDVAETYLLDDDDLRKLGIVSVYEKFKAARPDLEKDKVAA